MTGCSTSELVSTLVSDGVEACTVISDGEEPLVGLLQPVRHRRCDLVAGYKHLANIPRMVLMGEHDPVSLARRSLRLTDIQRLVALCGKVVVVVAVHEQVWTLRNLRQGDVELLLIEHVREHIAPRRHCRLFDVHVTTVTVTAK